MSFIRTKKLIAVLLLAVLFAGAFADSDYYNGKGQEGKFFFVLTPVMKNVDASEAAWLPSAISSPIKTQLKLYTGMMPVNLENSAKVQEIQRKAEEGAFDAATAVIEAGKFQTANYGVLVTVTKTGTTYQLSVSVTDLSTLAESVATVNNIKKATDLQEGAINAAIIQLAPQLGVKLTALGTYTLSETSDGTLEEQIRLAQQEAASYQATIDDLNRQLANLSTSEALLNQDALAQRAQAETEMQFVIQRQQAAQLKAQRLLEQQQKAEAEKAAASARSTAAKERVSNLSSQAEAIAAEVRAKKMDELSTEERIIIIEKKKAAYLELYRSIQYEIEDYYELAEEEYEDQYIDPYDPKNYPSAFYKNGVFNTDYQNMLINQNEEKKAELYREAEENIARTKAATDATLKTLVTEINSDLKRLSTTTFTLSSLANPEIFAVSEYNVNAYAWDSEIIFSMFNQTCSLATAQLSYQDVTGEKMPALKTAADFEDYASTYDIYDAMFRMGTPFLTLELDYTVEPDAEEYPSSYIIYPKGFRLTRTSDGKVLKRDTITIPSDEIIVFQYYPITDLSETGESFFITDNMIELKKQEEKAQAEQMRQYEEAKKKAERERAYENSDYLGWAFGAYANGFLAQGGTSGIGGDFGLSMRFPFDPNWRLDFGVRIYPAPSYALIGPQFGFYFDKEFNLFSKRAYLVYGGSMGPVFGTDDACYNIGGTKVTGIKYKKSTSSSSSYSSSSSSSSSSSATGDFCFVFDMQVGLNIPLTPRIALTTTYAADMLIGEKVYFVDRYSVGIVAYILSDDDWY